MTAFPGSPRVLKAGLVLVNPATGQLLRVISVQYNPDTLSRTLQVQSAAGGENADHSAALRLKGAAIETIKLEAQLDLTDQLEAPDQHPTALRLGLHPQLAVLEALAYPSSGDLLANDRLAASGTMEVLPVETPLTLFVWGRNRVAPVRLTDLSVTEEAFDAALNPIRAKVSLGLRVLSVDDLGFAHRGGVLFLGYLRAKEAFARKSAAVPLSRLGLEALP